MAVPNTNTFSLQDVVDNIAGLQDDLVECFAEATSGAFDPTYGSISDNDLLAFRNYNEDVATPTMSVDPSSAPTFVVGGGSFSGVSVTSNTTWIVSSKPSWITVSGESGSGDDLSVTLIAASNGTGAFRAGSVTFTTTSGSPVAEDSISVSQQSGFE